MRRKIELEVRKALEVRAVTATMRYVLADGAIQRAIVVQVVCLGKFLSEDGGCPFDCSMNVALELTGVASVEMFLCIYREKCIP